MGTLYNFECQSCDYSATVSGGKDYGMLATVRTMICCDCNELEDVLIGRCGQVGETGDQEYDKGLNICPECNSSSLKGWNPIKKPCPKCGDQMTEGQGPTIMWD